MEDGSSGITEWVNEVMRVYKVLSDEDKNSLLGNLLQESSFSQLYFLQENLHKLHHRDFMVLLPNEIVEHLLTFLDLKSLCNCCQVSQRWNSIITSCHSIWHAKCEEMGLRFSANTRNAMERNEETYKTLCLSMANKKQTMRNGQAFKTDILVGHSKRVTALKIWDKWLASGTDDGVLFIWDTEKHKIVNRHKLSEDFCITCISLDDQMLVVGSSTGFIASLALDMFQHKHLFGQFSAAVFSLDFNSSLNLVVSGSADNMIKIWSLSLGRLLRTLHGHTHWVVKVLIRPCPSQAELIDNLPSAYLVSMDKERILVWPIVKDVTNVLRHIISIPLMSCPHGFFTPGLHFDGHFLYFIRQHLGVKTSTMLCSYDIFTEQMVSEIGLHTHVKALQAVGSKYVCIITRHCEYREFPSAVFLERDTLKEVASLHLPTSRTIAPDQPHIAFGSVDWLDGLDGYNTTGTVIAVGCENGSIMVITWKS